MAANYGNNDVVNEPDRKLGGDNGLVGRGNPPLGYISFLYSRQDIKSLLFKMGIKGKGCPNF